MTVILYMFHFCEDMDFRELFSPIPIVVCALGQTVMASSLDKS